MATATTASKVTFPLSEDRIPKVQLSNAQIKEYRHLAHEIVMKTLDQETHFRYTDHEVLDERDWKFVKSKERMRVHKRITPSSPEEPLLPMVLAVGCLEGNLEDALYGMHHKTTEEMRITTAFLNKHHLDAAVLANIEVGTDDDPFRYLGLKWRVAQTPGGNFIKNRDASTLEHMGIEYDGHGNKYGFHLMKSVDIPDLPAFPASVVVRAQVMLCCIYRQITPTIVSAYCKSIFDLSGELIDYMSYMTAADMVLGISKALECAAAKRLTTLAMGSSIEIPGSMTRNSSRNSRDTESSMSECGESNHSNDATVADRSASDSCSVCTKKKRFFFSGPPLRTCRICLNAVCSKCFVKTFVFAKPRNRRVVCCKACVVESRDLAVDPRDPHPCILASAEP